MEGVPIFKVILLGDGNVGKTSLARRYCEGKFEVSRIMTIGVDFQTKVVNLPGQQVKLSIWDVAGSTTLPGSTREFLPRECLCRAGLRPGGEEFAG